MSREEIVIGGFGGQGIILAGYVVGKAATIFDHKNAALTQDYGPAARGGACRAQVIISDSPISYPVVENPSVMVVMSQVAYTKYTAGLSRDVWLFIEEDLVKTEEQLTDHFYAIPATRMAEELGRRTVSNVVMLGFLTAIKQIVSVEAMKESVLDSVPKGTEELNERAFARGYEYGLEKAKSG